MEISINGRDIVEALPIFFGVMIGICVICWIIIMVKNKENERKPLMRQHATLVEKPTIPPNSICITMQLTFQLDNGERVCVQTPPNQNLIIGDTGMLTWQGTAFRSFLRDTSKNS